MAARFNDGEPDLNQGNTVFDIGHVRVTLTTVNPTLGRKLVETLTEKHMVTNSACQFLYQLAERLWRSEHLSMAEMAMQVDMSESINSTTIQAGNDWVAILMGLRPAID